MHTDVVIPSLEDIRDNFFWLDRRRRPPPPPLATRARADTNIPEGMSPELWSSNGFGTSSDVVGWRPRRRQRPLGDVVGGVASRQSADDPVTSTSMTSTSTSTSTSPRCLCFRPPTKFVLNCLNFDLLQPIFYTKYLNFLEMDNLIRGEALGTPSQEP